MTKNNHNTIFLHILLQYKHGKRAQSILNITLNKELGRRIQKILHINLHNTQNTLHINKFT